MSISDVTSRMAAIQSQLDMLRANTGVATSASSSATGATAASASGFSAALSQATATTDATATTSTAGSATGDAVVAEAKKYLGVPYVWGGTSPTGMDCSGLVQLVYKSFGVELPRVSYQQAEAGRPVASMAEAQPGDLIAWDNSSRNNGVDHIAIYAGNGMMIEAPRTGLDVRMVPVPTTPDVIRRVLPDGAAGAIAGAPSPVGATGAATLPAGTPFADLFSRAGAAHGVSPALLSAVARQESGYDPGAVSPAGAQGLMQLMPGTAQGLGVSDSFNPTQAVDGAARLLSDLLGRFGSTELALAAYNAGPGAVMRYDGIPPYPETRTYVSSIMSTLGAAS